MMEPNPTLDAALDHAKQGWRVIPLHSVNDNGQCACGNADCKSIGKHPRIPKWQKNATKETKTVKNWFSTWPHANVGIVGGPESGIAILDIDPRRGGDKSLKELEAKYKPLPNTPSVATGGDGLHFYFRYPKTAITNKSGFRDGLDFKADNGYVVAPPSKHASGKIYQWKLSGVDGVEPAELPEWFCNTMTGTKPVAITDNGPRSIRRNRRRKPQQSAF